MTEQTWILDNCEATPVVVPAGDPMTFQAKAMFPDFHVFAWVVPAPATPTPATPTSATPVRQPSDPSEPPQQADVALALSESAGLPNDILQEISAEGLVPPGTNLEIPVVTDVDEMIGATTVTQDNTSMALENPIPLEKKEKEGNSVSLENPVPPVMIDLPEVPQVSGKLAVGDGSVSLVNLVLTTKFGKAVASQQLRSKELLNKQDLLNCKDFLFSRLLQVHIIIYDNVLNHQLDI